LNSALVFGQEAEFSIDKSVHKFPKTAEGVLLEHNYIITQLQTVEFGGDGVCYFEVTNTGNAPLILSNVKGSCQCTVPTWPKEPIVPRRTPKIKVKYNTIRAGEINKSVTITSNATNTPTKVVRIKGNVSAKASD
jgi:hypothetical protein|tara:strand:+ start:346 stop:750 length:405 start_codon:yes stop_codon:yes gene_type:complete